MNTAIPFSPIRAEQTIFSGDAPQTPALREKRCAHYGMDGANGRRLSDDAMDAALSWIVGAPVTDGVDQPAGRVTLTFPFVMPVT